VAIVTTGKLGREDLGLGEAQRNFYGLVEFELDHVGHLRNLLKTAVIANQDFTGIVIAGLFAAAHVEADHVNVIVSAGLFGLLLAALADAVGEVFGLESFDPEVVAAFFAVECDDHCFVFSFV